MIPAITKSVQLIGIHGKAGSGKDTIGCYISETFKDCYGDSFAAPLKACASEAFGIALEYFNDPEYKELPHDAWTVSPRKIAQFMGTEMFRDTVAKLIPWVDNNFWVHRLAKKINGDLDWEAEYADGDTVIITDVRFQNEVDFILDNDGVIFHVIRDGTKDVGLTGHPSESLVLEEGPGVYRILNVGTKEALYDQVANELKNSHLTLYHLFK